MPASNFTQYSFLGGERSPWALGRTELPTYRQSMVLSLNGFPVEEGAWTRRPGFADCGYTHKGLPGIIRSFVAGDIQTNGVNKVLLLELTSDETNGWLRFWVPGDFGYPSLLCYAAVGTITSFSGASPTLMTMSADQVAIGGDQAWTTGDTIFIKVNSGGPANGAQVNGRQFLITLVSATTFTLKDAATGANIDGSTLGSYSTTTATAKKIIVQPLPYTTLAETKLVRVVQSGIAVLLLSKTKSPWLLTIDDTFTVLSKDADFKDVDGPYLDPELGTSQTGNALATSSTLDGISYDLVLSTAGGAGYQFTSDDINRAFRVWTQPAAYDAGSSPYASGDIVTYNNAFWLSLANSNTALPGELLLVGGIYIPAWLLSPTAGRWTHGYISAVAGPRNITFHISFIELPFPLLRSVIDTWQVGEYGKDHFPAAGGWLDGRLLLGGARQNHVDASKPNVFDGVATYYDLFAPTDLNGGVFDDNALNEIYNAHDNNEILWFAPDRQGMIFGTENGEWLFGAGTAGDSLAPTSATIRNVSRFKSAFIDPIRVGTALLFVQAAGVKIYEYMVDAFSNRFTGRLMNGDAQHLPAAHGGIIDVAYQEDPVPCLWAACADGTLLGCTYRRYSDFATVPPEFNGWHQHAHGAGRAFTSIAIASITNGQDAIAGLTYDPSQAKHHVEVMSRIWGPE